MDKEEFIKWARELELDYTPNAQVMQDLAGIELFAMVGPTAAGKTTIIEKLGIPNVLGDVTRPIREGEKDGISYNFMNDYLGILKDIKTGNYVQFRVSRWNEFYGTRRNSFPVSGQCAMAIVASELPEFEKLGFKKITKIYVMPPGYVEWMHRMGVSRSADLGIRLQEARESIKIALADGSYKFVLNDDLEKAVSDTLNIINGGHPDAHREQLAKNTGDVLLERLGDQGDDL